MIFRGENNLLRQYLRMLYRCGAVATAMAGCFGEALLWRVVRRQDRPREYALHRWSGWLLRRLGVKLAVEGPAPRPGLIVSNHLSYLDILVFASIVPCSFVSKREIKHWPGIGWTASLSGVIYIDRASRSATRHLQPGIATALARGTRLVLFPEGTSGDGTTVMRFHSSLLEAAVESRAPITPAFLRYELDEGDPRLEVCYWGDMTLLPHALKLFRQREVRARVRFSTARIFSDRKQAARELWEEVTRAEESALAKNGAG
jgi:1-acyl-sn-glycerol-3-phosphate acyltransferase